MSKYGRFYRDNLEHKLLHRLPDGETATPCGLFDVAMVDQLFFDSVRFSGAYKCAPCFKDVDFTDVHTEHCCSVHGCKYGEEFCTVTRGVQSAPRAALTATSGTTSAWTRPRTLNAAVSMRLNSTASAYT